MNPHLVIIMCNQAKKKIQICYHRIFGKTFLKLHKSVLNFKNTTQFHKHKQQETNNFISKFTSLPKISTCISRRRHQAKSFSNLLTSDFRENFPETTQILPEIKKKNTTRFHKYKPTCVNQTTKNTTHLAL